MVCCRNAGSDILVESRLVASDLTFSDSFGVRLSRDLSALSVEEKSMIDAQLALI